LNFTISLFYGGESLGKTEWKNAALKLRLGLDTLSVNNASRNGTMISHVACHKNWTKEKMTTALLEKAGIKESLSNWRTYETRSWLSYRNNVFHLTNGFAKKPNVFINYDFCINKINALAQYILKQFKDHQIPEYGYWPDCNKWNDQGTIVRILLALNSLYAAGEVTGNNYYKEKAVMAIGHILERLEVEKHGISLNIRGLTIGVAAIPHVILALTKVEFIPFYGTKKFKSLLDKTVCFLHRDGSISQLNEGRQIGADHDFLPGAVLLGLSNYCHLSRDTSILRFIDAHFEWYRRRFTLLHPWGMVWWQIQGWTSIYRLTANESYKNFIFEIADWAMNHQTNNGSFLIDYSLTGPSFLTACVLEGIADAWQLAMLEKDFIREERYKSCWLRGIKFMNQLIVEEADTFFMPNAYFAVGGVRESPVCSYMRLDYTGHLLHAITKGIMLLGGGHN
jgi:hypothetical protein